jgi:hypothetical protein
MATTEGVSDVGVISLSTEAIASFSGSKILILHREVTDEDPAIKMITGLGSDVCCFEHRPIGKNRIVVSTTHGKVVVVKESDGSMKTKICVSEGPQSVWVRLWESRRKALSQLFGNDEDRLIGKEYPYADVTKDILLLLDGTVGLLVLAALQKLFEASGAQNVIAVMPIFLHHSL